jgi:hypothetical protein
MSKLTLVRTHQGSPHIQQASLRRDWMDATYNKHAYRCLPVSMANVSGWEILLPCDVVVKWDGGNSVPTLISGEEHDNRMVANCNKIGMVDFQLGWAFNTEEGHHTWITGPPNYFVDGAVPLSAVIPSDWWPDEVQMAWKITEVGKEVVFPKGMPFAFFFVFDSNLMPDLECTVENLWDKPDLIESRVKYNEAKMKKMQDEPWSWMNGIRTGLDADGNRIGPRHDGLVDLQDPEIPEVPNWHTQ